MRSKVILPIAILAIAGDILPVHAAVPSIAASAIVAESSILQIAKKKKSARRSEIDRSIDRGTVPSRYRKNVPTQYQRYVPFESDKRVY